MQRVFGRHAQPEGRVIDSPDARTIERGRRYERVWKRDCHVFHQSDDEHPHIDVYCFRPTWRFWAPLRDCVVYVTGGMSERDMPPIAGEAAQALHALAHTPWRSGISFAPLETVSWPGRFSTAPR